MSNAFSRSVRNPFVNHLKKTGDSLAPVCGVLARRWAAFENRARQQLILCKA